MLFREFLYNLCILLLFWVAVAANVAPMLLPCCSHVAPMLLPCCSRVAPVLLPCCSRVAPVLLPSLGGVGGGGWGGWGVWLGWGGGEITQFLSFCTKLTRLLPMSLPMLLPCCSHVAPVLLPCCSRVAPVLLPSLPVLISCVGRKLPCCLLFPLCFATSASVPNESMPCFNANGRGDAQSRSKPQKLSCHAAKTRTIGLRVNSEWRKHGLAARFVALSPSSVRKSQKQ